MSPDASKHLGLKFSDRGGQTTETSGFRPILHTIYFGDDRRYETFIIK